MAMRSHREAVGNEKTGLNWQAWKTILPVMCRTVWSQSMWKPEKARSKTCYYSEGEVQVIILNHPNSGKRSPLFPGNLGQFLVPLYVGEEVMFWARILLEWT